MYDDIDSTYYDPLDAVEETLALRAHSPRFWDAEGGEQASADPFEHLSWDVANALAEEGWEDPAQAVEIRELLVDDVRLVPLADTPYGRREVHRIDELFLDAPVGEEALHEQVLALVPVATDRAWPADEHELGVRAA